MSREAVGPEKLMVGFQGRIGVIKCLQRGGHRPPADPSDKVPMTSTLPVSWEETGVCTHLPGDGSINHPQGPGAYCHPRITHAWQVHVDSHKNSWCSPTGASHEAHYSFSPQGTGTLH